MTFTHSTPSSSGLVAEMAARARIKTTARTGRILGMLEVTIGMGIEHKGYSDYEDPLRRRIDGFWVRIVSIRQLVAFQISNLVKFKRSKKKIT
jgi:hypothetical protein